MGTSSPGNGNGPRGNGRPLTAAGALAHLSDRLMAVLPPAMVVLIVLNIAFLGTTMWLVQHNADYRNALLTKIVESCLVKSQ